MGNDTRQLPAQTIDAISKRLATLVDLRVPAQLRQQPQGEATEESKRSYLQKLLLHDPGVFLERHGSSLTVAERGQFECLRGDYEVDFYLKLLEDQQDERKAGQLARNRRLAYMNRLVKEGSYFSEKEMRERQPGMYHQYIGQYRPPETVDQGSCQAGCILAESIMRQQEELGMRQRQQAEQQAWDHAAAQQESESESEEEDEEEGQQERDQGRGAGQPAPAPAPASQQQEGQQQQQAGSGGGGGGGGLGPAAHADQGSAAAAAAAGAPAGAQGSAQRAGTNLRAVAVAEPGDDGMEEGEGEEEEHGPAYVHIPEAEAADYASAFLDIMKQRFLAGQDAGHVDYAAIDADAELDEDWAVEAGRDAEDKYFDEDE